MATLNLVPTKPAPVQSIVVEPVVGGIVVSWPKLEVAQTYEVWRNDTNTLSGAVLIKDQIAGSSFTDAIAPFSATVGGGPFYWVRPVDAFGTAGDFQVGSKSQFGLGFKQSKASLSIIADAAVTYSVDTVQVRVYYTPSGGSPTNTGLINFTTVPETVGSWTGAVNAIGNADGVFAVGTIAADETVSLIYSLSDLTTIPDTATITGVQFSVVAKSNHFANTFAVVSIGGGEEDVADLTADNTAQTKLAGTSTSMYGLGDNGAFTFLELVPAEAVGAPQLANQTANVMLNVFANGFAINDGATSTQGSVGEVTSIGTTTEGVSSGSAITRAAHEPTSSWNTWVDIGSTAGVAINPGPAAVFTSATLDIDWTSLSVVSGDVKIEAQLVLRNRTDNTDVKTETFTLMHWNGASNTLMRSNSIIHWDYVWSGLGSTLNNKAYDVRWRMRKTRTDGAATLTMYYNRMYIETSIA